MMLPLCFVHLEFKVLRFAKDNHFELAVYTLINSHPLYLRFQFPLLKQKQSHIKGETFH
jgi:hypothetical protein